MRLIIKIVLAGVVLATLAVAAVAVLVPTDVVRERVVALVEAETGRRLTIDGDASFTLFPNLGVTLSDVSLSNPPGMDEGAMLRTAALTIELQLMPLLSRSVEVERFVMERPVIELRIDASGRPNWLFERDTAQGAAEETQAAPPMRAGLAVRPAFAQSALQGLRLGDVRIEEGVVAFEDERTGVRHVAEAVNAAFELPGFDAPLAAKGDLGWRGERVAFAAHVDSVPALMEGAESPLAVTLDSRLLEGSFNGAADLDGAAKGDLEVRSPSLRALAAWLDMGLPPGEGLESASFTGRLVAGETAVEVSEARLSLDGMTAEGEASLAFAKARPRLEAAFNVDKIDINPYLAAPRESEAPARSAPAGREESPQPRPDQSLTDFIEELNRSDSQGERPVPEVQGWRDSAYDLTPLRALDADIRLTAGAIRYQELSIGRSALQATLRDGMLTADLTDFQLYEGVGSGRLTLNAARDVPAMAARLELEGVSALPLLTDAMDFDWISGEAQLALDLAGAGRSESELVRSLKGEGTMQFEDGAIEGVNIPQMVRAFQAGQFTEWRRQEELKTDFSRLSGTFDIRQGVARSEDLEMLTPLLRVTGTGDIDLPRERLDFRLMPRVVASLEGQGGAQDLTGLVIPVRLQGPFGDPRLRPDVERLMQDPELAEDAAERIGQAVEDFRDGDGEQVRQLLDNLLGGDGGGESGESDAEGEPAQRQRPSDVLRELFR